MLAQDLLNRVQTRSQPAPATIKSNTGVKGVCQVDDRKFLVSVYVDSKTVHLGTFRNLYSACVRLASHHQVAVIDLPGMTADLYQSIKAQPLYHRRPKQLRFKF